VLGCASRDLLAQVLQRLGVLVEDLADAYAVVVLDRSDEAGGALAVAVPRAAESDEPVAGRARDLRDAPEDQPLAERFVRPRSFAAASAAPESDL
jgi:hypothetical protein